MINPFHTALSVALASLGLTTGCLSHHAGALPNEPRSEPFASVRGARIRYVDEGEGPAVVMIHGFASGLHTWAAVSPELTDNHRVLALDLKGFGWSDRPEGDYSPAEQARIVLALMDARGIERAAIVGHSYGASVALALALAAPERVTRLALYDAWVYEAQLPTFFHMARTGGVGEALFAAFYDQRPEDRMALAFHDPSVIEQDFVDHAIEMLARPGTRAAALAAVRAMNYAEVEERYASIDKPVLLLWGEEDLVTPLDYGQRLYNELPNARLETFPQCGHFPMIEAFHPSTRALVEFLNAETETETDSETETETETETDSDTETGAESESESDSESETETGADSDSESETETGPW